MEKSPLLNSEKKQLSFCITHQNRISYLKSTLPKNLEDNAHLCDKIEFVLVDFDLSNELQEWIYSTFINEIGSGYLSYYRADFLKTWSASIAKNTAHQLGNGAILVNLDCDNFTGFDGGKYVIDHFLKAPYNIFLWQFSGRLRDGSFGRMSLTRDVFYELGGYDEEMLEMGYQDKDLMCRGLKLGLQLVKAKARNFNVAIKHQKYKPSSMSFLKMNRNNLRRSKNNIKRNVIRANGGLLSLRGSVRKMNAKGEMLAVSID